MSYVIYPFLALIGLLFNVFCMATCWFWAFWAAAFNLTKLPGIMAWVHTHDDDVYGSNTTGESVPKSFFKRWTTASWWIMRNPGYTFDSHVLGIREDRVDRVETTGDQISGRKDTIFLKKSSRTYWGYSRDLYYKKNGSMYFKMWFGWHRNAKAGYHMLKISINPFKKKEK